MEFAPKATETEAVPQTEVVQEEPGQATGDIAERAKSRLEQQEAEAKAAGTYRQGQDDDIMVLGPRRYTPMQIQGMMPDKKYLLSNKNPQIRAMHQAEGWVESRNPKSRPNESDTFDTGDLRQMEMPIRQYEETIEAPEIRRRNYRIGVIENDFHNAGEAAARATNGGVETFGNIKVDRRHGS